MNGKILISGLAKVGRPKRGHGGHDPYRPIILRDIPKNYLRIRITKCVLKIKEQMRKFLKN